MNQSLQEFYKPGPTFRAFRFRTGENAKLVAAWVKSVSQPSTYFFGVSVNHGPWFFIDIRSTAPDWDRISETYKEIRANRSLDELLWHVSGVLQNLTPADLDDGSRDLEIQQLCNANQLILQR